MYSNRIKASLLRNTKSVNGCLVWTLKPHASGYGKINVMGKTKATHRVAWEIANEREIPEGLTIDHTCFNKLCVYSKHLELVTLEENNRRWYAKFLKDNPTFPCGHKRDGEITKYKNKTYKSGTIKYQKRCTICWKAYQKEYQKKYHAKTK